jgi:hypothetical protein
MRDWTKDATKVIARALASTPTGVSHTSILEHSVPHHSTTHQPPIEFCTPIEKMATANGVIAKITFVAIGFNTTSLMKKIGKNLTVIPAANPDIVLLSASSEGTSIEWGHLPSTGCAIIHGRNG